MNRLASTLALAALAFPASAAAATVGRTVQARAGHPQTFALGAATIRGAEPAVVIDGHRITGRPIPGGRRWSERGVVVVEHASTRLAPVVFRVTAAHGTHAVRIRLTSA